MVLSPAERISMVLSPQQDEPPVVPNHSSPAVEIINDSEYQIYVASLLQHHQEVAVYPGQYDRRFCEQQFQIRFLTTLYILLGAFSYENTAIHAAIEG